MAKDRSLIIAIVGIVIMSLIIPIILFSSGQNNLGLGGDDGWDRCSAYKQTCNQAGGTFGGCTEIWHYGPYSGGMKQYSCSCSGHGGVWWTENCDATKKPAAA